MKTAAAGWMASDCISSRSFEHVCKLGSAHELTQKEKKGHHVVGKKKVNTKGD